jgi:hypothetical protein
VHCEVWDATERPWSCNVSQPSVLIISDEPEFASTMMARWQTERSVPTFLLMTTPAWSESLVASCDLAVIAGVKKVVAPLFKKVDEAGKPAILLAPGGLDLQRVRSQYPRFMLVREHEGWVDVVVARAAPSRR